LRKLEEKPSRNVLTDNKKKARSFDLAFFCRIDFVWFMYLQNYKPPLKAKYAAQMNPIGINQNSLKIEPKS
jgi:hypothetical protein